MSCQGETLQWQLEWSDGLSVHIPQIDAEHQHFIGLVNGLNLAIVSRRPLGEIKQHMQVILDDAAAHFAHEEVLLREWAYPEVEQHVRKHGEALQAMNALMMSFRRGGNEYQWIEAGLKVKQTLVEHLLCEDMKYRDYCLTHDCRQRGP